VGYRDSRELHHPWHSTVDILQIYHVLITDEDENGAQDFKWQFADGSQKRLVMFQLPLLDLQLVVQAFNSLLSLWYQLGDLETGDGGSVYVVAQ
jgi:hypothetical protein